MSAAHLSDHLSTPAFSLVYEVLRETEWDENPLTSMPTKRGRLQAGDTLLLSTCPPGSGPHWQQAQLVTGMMCFVRPDDIKPRDAGKS